METAKKKYIWATIAVSACLLVILNVASFAIPFTKLNNATFIACYICTEFFILCETGIVISSLLCDKPYEKVLGLPIAWSGGVGTLVQAIVTICLYVVNAFYDLPVWIVIVIECLLIAYFVAQICLGFVFKAHAVSVSENKPDTAFMDELNARLSSLVKKNRAVSASKALEDAYDTSRGSDPISYESTSETENQILDCLSSLESAVDGGEAGTIIEESRRMSDLLSERRAICKKSK